MIKEQIRKWVIFWVSTFFTLFVCFVWYATVINVWTNTSELEVTTNSTLSAESWNKLLWNFEFLKSEIHNSTIIWSWVQTSERNWLWRFIWDQKIIDTSWWLFWWTPWQNFITINQSWYYEIYWDVLWSWLSDNQRQDARLAVDRSWTIIHLSFSLWMGGISQTYAKHHLKEIWYFQEWDVIYIDIALAWGRYGHSTWSWSQLTIKKL